MPDTVEKILSNAKNRPLSEDSVSFVLRRELRAFQIQLDEINAKLDRIIDTKKKQG